MDEEFEDRTREGGCCPPRTRAITGGDATGPASGGHLGQHTYERQPSMTLVGLPLVDPACQPWTKPALGVNGAADSLARLIKGYQDTLEELEALKRDRRRVARKLHDERELRPWQVE